MMEEWPRVETKKYVNDECVLTVEVVGGMARKMILENGQAKKFESWECGVNYYLYKDISLQDFEVLWVTKRGFMEV